MTPELQHEIERLKQIFASHGMPFEPNKGVSEDRLAWLERELGYTLDRDIRDLYRFAEGAERGNYWVAVGEEDPQMFRLLRIDESAQYWFSLPLDDKHDQKLYKQLEYNFRDCEDERDARVQPRRWMHRRWWPLANTGNSHSLMFDSDPAPGGKYGQIIAFYHDPDEIVLIADSFMDLLRESNSLLETRWEEFHYDGEDEGEE